MTTRRPAHSSPPPTPANSRPGANGVWLDPGTCAFANREWIPGELPGVQFEVVQGASGGSGPVSIPEYLRDESQYWRFAVYRTAYGYYQATHHESWRPAASPTGSELDEWRTPVHGGPGGVPFEDACESGSYLAGIEARVGRDVDAVAPVCARLRPDGSRGAVVTGSLHGGSGGDHQRLVCPERYPFVRTLRVDWEGQETLVLDMIGFACGPMRGPLPRRVPGFNYLAASGPPAVAKSDFIFVSEDVPRGHASVDCPDGFAYAGLHGRAYAMVDALGAICREIPATPR